jgi:hypothetical protein
VRPNSLHYPSIEPGEELSDVGSLVVVAQAPHHGVNLPYQLASADRSLALREPTNLVLEVADRFLPGIGIEPTRSDTALDLAGRQAHSPVPLLDLVSEKLEALPDVHNPCLSRIDHHAKFFEDTTDGAARVSAADVQVITQSSAYLVS